MTVFSEQSFVERVLIVFHADGTLRGVHADVLTRTLRDGAVIAEAYNAAAPVTADEMNAILPSVGGLLMQAHDLIVGAAKLEIRIQDADAANSSLSERLTEAESANAILKDQLLKAQTEADICRAQRDEAVLRMQKAAP